MPRINIGKVPTFKEVWDSNKTYNRLQQVVCLGSTFQSRIDGNKGTPPAEYDSNHMVQLANEDKWICIAYAIDATNAGERINILEDKINRNILNLSVDDLGRIQAVYGAEGNVKNVNMSEETGIITANFEII